MVSPRHTLRTPSVSTIREHESHHELQPQRLIVTPATPATADATADGRPGNHRAPSLPRPPPPPQPSSTPPLPSAAAAAATLSALTAPAVVSPALLLVPRPVRLRLWLFLYSFPLALWISASIVLLIANYTRSAESSQRDGNLYFFRPEAPETSGAWVLAGWIANWISGVAQCALIVAIWRKRSPFFSGITLGSLLSLVVMCIAPIAHSNALLARDVLDPIHDSIHAAVQLEWIALGWSLILVSGLLIQAPRRIQMPLAIAVRAKTNLELRALLRQAQGDLAAAQATMHQRLYGGSTSNGNGAAVGQTEPGYGLNTLARSQLKDILRSTRGNQAFASMDQPLVQPASGAGGTSSQPNSARSVSCGSASSGDEALSVPPVHHRTGSHRARSRRASSLERGASSLALVAVTTDSRDMQKFSSAVRAASTAAAERLAEGFAVESLDAPVPAYMLEPPGSGAAAGAGTAGTGSMRSHRSRGSHRRAQSQSKSKAGGGGGGATRSHKKRHGHGRSVADSSASGGASNEVDFFTAARDELARPPTLEEQVALQQRIREEQLQREREEREATAGRWV